MEIINKAGYLILLIIGCSTIALTVIIERWRFYRRVEREEREVMRKIRTSLTSLTEQDVLADIPDGKNRDNFLAGIYRAALEICRQGEKPDVIADDCLAMAASRLEQYLYILATIATIAPLLGLLGTVLGMIKTFHAASISGVGDPHRLAEGISEALYNTAAGLMVTVPCIIAYNYFRSHAEGLLKLLESRTQEIIRLLVRRGETTCR